MKTKPKSKPSKQSDAFAREKDYWRSLDLRDLWQEFATAMNKNGTCKYPTVWAFIKAKAKHGWQRDFLYWLIGPPAESKGSPYEKAEFPQYDWAQKRERGFWYSSENINNLTQEIKRKNTSFDRLQTAGESLLHDLAELAEMQKQITKEFGGQLFLEGNTAEENSARVSLFISLKQQIHDMKAKVLSVYAKTQGMDMNQLSNFLEIFASGIGQAASAQLGYGGGQIIESEAVDKDKKRYSDVLSQLNNMMLQKSADLDLALPSEAEAAIKTVINGKAKRVQ